MSNVYISGPVTESEESLRRFEIAAKKLTDAGHSTTNLIDLKKALKARKGRVPKSDELSKYCIEKLLDCDAIYFIDTEEETDQSILEKEVATRCGIPEIEVYFV